MITLEQYKAAAARVEQGKARLGDLATLRAVVANPERLVTRGWWSL